MDPSTIQRLGDVRYQEIVTWAAQQAAIPPSPRQWTVRGLLAALWGQSGPARSSAFREPGYATGRNGCLRDECDLSQL